MSKCPLVWQSLDSTVRRSRFKGFDSKTFKAFKGSRFKGPNSRNSKASFTQWRYIIESFAQFNRVLSRVTLDLFWKFFRMFCFTELLGRDTITAAIVCDCEIHTVWKLANATGTHRQHFNHLSRNRSYPGWVTHTVYYTLYELYIKFIYYKVIYICISSGHR